MCVCICINVTYVWHAVYVRSWISSCVPHPYHLIPFLKSFFKHSSFSSSESLGYAWCCRCYESTYIDKYNFVGRVLDFLFGLLFVVVNFTYMYMCIYGIYVCLHSAQK